MRLALSLSSTNEAFKCGLTITHLPEVLLVTTLQPHVDVCSRAPLHGLTDGKGHNQPVLFLNDKVVQEGFIVSKETISRPGISDPDESTLAPK